MSANTAQGKSRNSVGRRQSNVPRGTDAIPRFAPSAAALGSAFAEQILEDFRHDLEGVDLKAKSPQKRARK